MLTKMGWQSGKGLGAKEDGSTTHVKSVKRRDNLGKNRPIDRQGLGTFHSTKHSDLKFWVFHVMSGIVFSSS